MIGLPSLRIRWVLAAVLSVFGLLWLSGCENTIEYARYPKDLEYPLRTDLIVPQGGATPTKNDFFYAAAPGRLEEEITQFKTLGGGTLDPNGVSAAQREQLQKSLQNVFGTPRQPRVGAETGENPDLVVQLTKLKVRDADGAAFKTLSQGSRVYRYHCVHCHGLTGDGRGPTGPWVVPHPRDYRSGWFKFVSAVRDIGNNGKPRRDDLVRVLHNGIESTSMPSFALLDVKEPNSTDKETDLEAAVSYVMHLSIRGSVEIKVVSYLNEGNEIKDQAAMDANVHDALTEIVGQWAGANDHPIEPGKDSFVENQSRADREKAIRHGFELFSDPSGDASCIKCHVDYGRQANFRYDMWGTLVRPMNLTTGVYRGGRRPIDVYWRIKAGIFPSGMSDAKTLTDDKDVWALVSFVNALPYPQMLPEDVRKKIYDPPPDDGGKADRAEK